MGIFSNPQEEARKRQLRVLEDKRVAFAQRLAREGFAPERMLFLLKDDGGFGAVCAFGGQRWLILSPALGSDADFSLEPIDVQAVQRRQVDNQAEGMGGMFGFGKRAQHGVEYRFPRKDGDEAVLPAVFARGAWAEYSLARNPLLKTQRRRGDANLVWDLRPIEARALDAVLDRIDALLGQ